MDPQIDFPAPGQTTVVGGDRARVDARAKVLGQARYAAEFDPPGVLHAATVRAPIARGGIRRVNARAARRAPGVVAVFHPGAVPELADMTNVPDVSIFERRPPIQAQGVQGERIEYAGQIVAVAVARTLEEAEHAARLIEVDYRVDRAAVTLGQGAGGAERPETTIGQAAQIDNPAAIRAAEGAPVRVDATYRIGVHNHHPMETNAIIARWEADRLTVWETTQGVVGARNGIATALGIPASQVRVICPYVGGGFGCKGVVWPHTPLIAAVSRELGRPVKLMLTRQEMTHGTGHRPETVQRIRIGADESGRLRGLVHDTTAQTAVAGPGFVEPASLISRVSYAAPEIAISTTAVPLHRPVPSFMRGPGENPGSFALESAIDEAAFAAGVDPVEFRLLNQPAAHPLDGKPWSLRRTEDCLRRGAERIGWSARAGRPGALTEDGWAVGYGCAQAMFPGNRWGGAARVRMDFDGSVTVSAGTQDIGTGTYTILAEAAAESLGVQPERVRVVLGDSDLPQCGTSGGSSTAASVIPAVLAACETVKARLVRMASEDDESPLSGVGGNPVGFGNARLTWGRRFDPLGDLLARNSDRLSAADAPEGTAILGLPETLGDYALDSSGAQFCRVRVRPDTGEWRIDRWVGVFDVGRILNARLATSQLKGGIIYGFGAAFMEATATDPRTGRVVTRGLADYHVPAHADVPEIEVDWIGEPDPIIGPLGNRGIGEIGCVGVAAAIANAIHNATGRRIRDLPMVPERIMGAA